MGFAGRLPLSYIHGPGIDEPLAVDDGATIRYFHRDALGSVAKLTSSAGVVTLSRRYDPWGNLEAGASEEGHAFTGREWDPETGLYCYRARYYDPKVGRFTSEDPISPGSRILANQFYDLSEFDLEEDIEANRGSSAGIWPEDLNLYEFVYSNPPNFTDPTGEHPAARAAAAAARAAWARWGRPAAKWAWTKTKQAWQNLDFDGPQRGGRICQIRWKKKPVCRLDYHPIPGSHQKNRLHLNVGPKQTEIPIDPRCFLD